MQIFAARPTTRRWRRKSTKINLTGRFLFLFLLLGGGGLIGYVIYQRYIQDLSNIGDREPKPTKVAKVAAKPSGPTAAELERAAAEERVRKKAKFEKALADLMQTLIRRELSGPFGAQSLVAQARANAQTPEEQSTVDKYEKLSNCRARLLAGRW